MLLKGVESSTAYIDDVLTHSKTLEEHMEHLRRLLVKLKESGVKVKTTVKKCKIACKETMFLGYKISDQGVTIDETRIDALKKYPKPKTPKQVKQFLGLAGYYRQFIPNFSSIVNPITQLTKKSVKFVWNEECDMVFKNYFSLEH